MHVYFFRQPVFLTLSNAIDQSIQKKNHLAYIIAPIYVTPLQNINFTNINQNINYNYKSFNKQITN